MLLYVFLGSFALSMICTLYFPLSCLVVQVSAQILDNAFSSLTCRQQSHKRPTTNGNCRSLAKPNVSGRWYAMRVEWRDGGTREGHGRICCGVLHQKTGNCDVCNVMGETSYVYVPSKSRRSITISIYRQEFEREGSNYFILTFDRRKTYGIQKLEEKSVGAKNASSTSEGFGPSPPFCSQHMGCTL